MQPLSPDIRQRIIDMRAKGMTYQKIQDELGVSLGVISKLVGVGLDGSPRKDTVFRMMDWSLKVDNSFLRLEKRIADLEDCLKMIVDILGKSDLSQAKEQGKGEGESRFQRDEHEGVSETESGGDGVGEQLERFGKGTESGPKE